MAIKKRILLDCSTMNTFGSGLYYYCLNLGLNVEKILQEEQNDISIEMFVPPSAANAFSSSSKIHIKHSGIRKYFNTMLNGCDILHLPFQTDKMLTRKLFHPKVKIITTIHDLNVLHENIAIEKRAQAMKAIQSNIDISDAIVCISNFCRKDVEKHCSLKNQQFFTIHNGVHFVPAGLLKMHSYKPQLPFLLCIGFVNPKKNFHSILPLLTDEKFELIIIGKIEDENYRNKIMTIAESFNVANRIKFTGLISEEEKGWYLENCYAYFQPSIAEGFGAPVVEAMKIGKPLFLSTYTSLPEVGGDLAFYFQNFETSYLKHIFYKGMDVYNNSNLKQKLQERATQFSWEKQAIQYLDMYKSLLQSI